MQFYVVSSGLSQRNESKCSDSSSSIPFNDPTMLVVEIPISLMSTNDYNGYNDYNDYNDYNGYNDYNYYNDYNDYNNYNDYRGSDLDLD